MGGGTRLAKRAPATMLAAAIAAALIVVPRPNIALADMSSAYVISGGGWGHGLGMSQWGAKGYADKGWSATQIVTHYYSTTTVGTAPVPPNVRVGIAQDYRDITLIPNGDLTFKAGSTVVATAHANETWKVTVNSNGSYALARNGSTVVSATGSPSANVVAGWNSLGGNTVRVPDTGNTYRWGPMELNTYSTSSGYRMRAILVIAPIDRYLYGLGEVPSSWPAAALQAQAIAARTYAVNKINRLGQNRTGCNCGVYASTIDQAYVGYSKETGSYSTNWIDAVNATSGKMALYSGSPIEAYYSSSTGGYTENNENVWGGSPVAYLRGVADDGDVESPDHSWTVNLSGSAMQSKLNAFSDTAVGTLSNVETLAPYGVSGRVLWPTSDSQGGVRITGSGGTKRVSGSRLEAILGLKSTKFRITRTTQAPPVSTLNTFQPFSSQAAVFVAGGNIETDRRELVTAMDQGYTPTVRSFLHTSDDHMIRTSSFDAYGTYTGGVRVAVGDVDPATANEEIVTTPGARTWSRVRIWSLSSGLHMIKEFDAYAGSQNGVYVAAGPVDGPGQAEIITAPGPGGGSTVRVFKFAAGAITMMHQFEAYPGWSGGVRVAVGDFDGNGTAEIATVPGSGTAPEVKIFNASGSLVRSFVENPGSSTFTGGAYVGAADVDGDHKAELLLSYDKGTQAVVKVIHEATSSVMHVWFYAFGNWTNGVRVSSVDWNNDGHAEVLTSVGPNGNATVRTYET